MSEGRNFPPPGRPVGQGDKYDMIRLFLASTLGVSVEDWIKKNRAKSGGSYYKLSDDLNALLRDEYGSDAPRVTFESIRRWDPDGEYQRKARERQAALAPDPASDPDNDPGGDPATDPPSGAAPPVQFQPPEMAQEVE